MTLLSNPGRARNALQLTLLPALSGALAFASFPTVNQGYLAWVAALPLILFVSRTRSSGRAFWGGFFAGGVQFFALLVWTPQVLERYGNMTQVLSWVLYLLMVGALSCFPGAACAVTRYCMNRLGARALLVFPAVWVAFELFRNYAPFGGFPWLLTGYSQTDYLRLAQVSEITGVYGVSFLVVWINTALSWALLRSLGKPQSFVPLAGGMLLIAGCILYGERSLQRWSTVEPAHTAALLQGNLSHDEAQTNLAWKFQDGYIRMADRLEGTRVDLLVLPESPTPLMFQYHWGYRRALQQLAGRYSFGMIFNNISVSQDGGAERYFNSAYFLSAEGTELGRYDKLHLVPFGEYVPWKRIFFFVETITRDVSDFHPGGAYTVVRIGDHALSALICFEAVFPELARVFVRRGSGLIVNLTNDGWYGDSAAPHQHLAMARWRAVENRRYILRAANSGISAIVEPTGRLLAATGLLREDICVGQFAFITEQTWYARHGDVFALLCVIITFVSVGWSIAKGRSDRHD